MTPAVTSSVLVSRGLSSVPTVYNAVHHSCPLSASLHCNATVSLYSTAPSQEDNHSTTNNTAQKDNEPTAKDLRILRVAMVVGPLWFIVLVYLCFFREEKEDGGVMDYLTQDPRHNDRLPEDIRRKARQLYGDSDNEG